MLPKEVVLPQFRLDRIRAYDEEQEDWSWTAAEDHRNRKSRMSLRAKVPDDLACGLFGISSLFLALITVALRLFGPPKVGPVPLVVLAVIPLLSAVGGLFLGIRCLRRARWKIRQLPRRRWVLAGTPCSVLSPIVCVLIVPGMLIT